MKTIQEDDENLLTTSHVRAHYGGISAMGLWRWLRDENLGFPAPIIIKRRRFWKKGQIRAFDALAAASGKAKARPLKIEAA